MRAWKRFGVIVFAGLSTAAGLLLLRPAGGGVARADGPFDVQELVQKLILLARDPIKDGLVSGFNGVYAGEVAGPTLDELFKRHATPMQIVEAQSTMAKTQAAIDGAIGSIVDAAFKGENLLGGLSKYMLSEMQPPAPSAPTTVTGLSVTSDKPSLIHPPIGDIVKQVTSGNLNPSQFGVKWKPFSAEYDFDDGSKMKFNLELSAKDFVGSDYKPKIPGDWEIKASYGIDLPGGASFSVFGSGGGTGGSYDWKVGFAVGIKF